MIKLIFQSSKAASKEDHMPEIDRLLEIRGRQRETCGLAAAEALRRLSENSNLSQCNNSRKTPEQSLTGSTIKESRMNLAATYISRYSAK